MRLAHAFPLLATLLRGASGTSLTSHVRANPLDVRDLADVCASVHADLVVPDLFGILTAVGAINVCLCLSAIPLFLETNVVALLAVTIAGEPVVTSMLTNLINGDASSSQCSYPSNSVPACIDGNPCRFTCENSFAPSPPENPTSCICAPPNQVCNGVCTSALSCTSPPPSKRDKRWVGSGACSARGGGHMACGVFGGGARAWECVDTNNDLESCGGCILPLTPYTPTGLDCTVIPGVADVSCHKGACVVRRCLPGYTLSLDSLHCIRDRSKTGGTYGKSVPASQYGLEHVQLQAL